MKRFLLMLLLIPNIAGAVGEICGDSVDNDGSGGDAACAEPDKDRDGYPSSDAYTGPYGGAIDCNDSNRFIIPGTIDTAGCSANQFRRCKSDGTFTSCANLSSASANDFSAAANGLALFYVDTAKTADTGSGTFASPLSPRSLSDAARSTYHAPVAGDVIVWLGTGDYASTWSDGGTTRMFHVNNKDGNSTNPIRMIFLSGANIVGQGTSPTEVFPMQIESSDYWIIQGESNTSINSGYSNTGIYLNGGSNCEVFGMNINSLDGNAANNVAGIKVNGGSNTSLHHNKMFDNYSRSAPTNENNAAGATFFSGTNNTFNDNVVYQTVAGGAGMLTKYKHGQSGANWSVNRNVFYGGRLGCVNWSQPNATIKNNYMEECQLSNGASAAMRFIDLGLNAYYDSAVVQYNTVKNDAAIEIFNSAGTETGTTVITYSENVVIDNRGTAYPSDGSDGFMRIGNYGSNAQYTTVVTGGRMTFQNNCYYNSAGTTLVFDLFADSSGSGYGPSGSSGQNYSGLAAWQAAGFDSGSFNENPTLDSDGKATSANCTDFGWDVEIFTATAGAPPSTGTTSSGQISPVMKRKRRR